MVDTFTHVEERDGRHLGTLLVLFVGSGCAALIYEVVWFQLLRQVVGASAISLGILLAAYMGGMFLGSLALPAWVSTRHHPLRVYAVLEVGIGVLGIAILLFLPLARSLYVAVVGYGFWGIFLRALVCGFFLLPPTVLMGATLPAIARWMKTTRVGISNLGFLYTANIIGAMVGTLGAGFWLLRVYDMLVATLFAAALNATVALVAYSLATRTEYVALPAEEAMVRPDPANRWVYAVIAVSGLTSLGAQVVWTRLLSLLFGATVYTFSIILAVFLLGLAIGSSAGSLLARWVRSSTLALAWCQLLLVLTIPFAAFMIAQELPFWYGNPAHAESLSRYVHDLLRATVAMLPATILWGASFPLALAAVSRKGREPGHLVGTVYAANTIGAIAGPLIFTMLMIPSVGTQASQQRLTLLAGGAALALFASHWWSNESRKLAPAPLVGTAAMIALTLLMAGSVSAVPPGLVAYGRMVSEWDVVETYHYVGEGMNTSVAVSDWPEDNIRSFHVGGKVVASTRQVDMRLQRMLGHLPGVMHPDPKSVLVVGFGAGVTTGSFVLYPEVERIVVVEIEPLVPQAAGRYFAPQNYDVLNDPRTEVIFDDARHFIATTDEKFDIITSDPIHPWVSGSAALYSSEYYELVKQHLNPGGIVTQWVPLYESSEEAVKSEVATFMQAFPLGTLWNSDIFGSGYDIVMLGQVEESPIDVLALAARLDANPDVRRSLSEIDFWTVEDVLGTYISQGSDLIPWTAGAQINRDRSLRLQYLAGLAIDTYKGEEIYNAMARYRIYPSNLFMAPQWIEDQLRMSYPADAQRR